MSEWENGRITSATLHIENGFMLTFWITVEARGAGQSCGGYVLATESKKDGFGRGFKAIFNLLRVVGVERWEDLKGQLVRVQFDGIGSMKPPLIANILEDRIWDIDKEMKVRDE